MTLKDNPSQTNRGAMTKKISEKVHIITVTTLILVIFISSLPAGGSDATQLLDRKLPDLALKNVEIDPVNPEVNQTVRIKVIWTNQGNATAEGELRVMLNGKPLASVTKHVFPGLLVTNVFQFAIKEEGDHEIEIMLDPDNLIKELDETNNKDKIKIKVTVKVTVFTPDIVAAMDKLSATVERVTGRLTQTITNSSRDVAAGLGRIGEGLSDIGRGFTNLALASGIGLTLLAIAIVILALLRRK